MLVGDVAPHHHTLAVGAKHAVDAVDVLIVHGFCPQRIDVGFGRTLTKALGFVAIDVEIRRFIGSCYLAEMVFQKFVGLISGRVEVPFCVGQMAIEGIAQNLLKMPKTLLVANDLDVVWLAEVFQFLDFLGGEGIGGRYVGVALGFEGVLGVKRERIEFAFSHLRDEAFQVVHADYGSTADVVLPSAYLEVGPVGDGHAGDDDGVVWTFQISITIELFQTLSSIKESGVGGGFQSDEIAVDRQAVGLVLVFAHAKVVGLDELDEMHSFDDTA